MVSPITTENHVTTLMELTYYNAVGIRLERIADHIVRIAKTVTHLKLDDKIILNKKELSEMSKTCGYFSQLNDLISHNNRKMAHSLVDEINTRIHNDFRRVESPQANSFNRIIKDSVGRIQSYVINIAEEVINCTSYKKLN